MAMHKYQALEKEALGNGNVACHGSLSEIQGGNRADQDTTRFPFRVDVEQENQTCIPSAPLIPTPISASWIMPTSFAPSPILVTCTTD
jgi:hypothetical protein